MAPLRRCPGKTGCNHIMEEKEICQIANIALEKAIYTAPESERVRKMGAKLHLAKGHNDNNHMRCVGCAGNFIQIFMNAYIHFRCID